MKIKRRRWTPEEEETAITMYREHRTGREIAQHLNRTRVAVWKKLEKLGETRQQPSYKTHYRCHRCGWIKQENCIEREYGYRCPHCGSKVRLTARRYR